MDNTFKCVKLQIIKVSYTYFFVKIQLILYPRIKYSITQQTVLTNLILRNLDRNLTNTMKDISSGQHKKTRQHHTAT